MNLRKLLVTIFSIFCSLSFINAQDSWVDLKGRRYVIIKTGETFNTLKERFKVTKADLLNANRQIVDINRIPAGDTLFLPSAYYQGGPPDIGNGIQTGIAPPNPNYSGTRYDQPNYDDQTVRELGSQEIQEVRFRGGTFVVCKFDPRKFDFWLLNRYDTRSRQVHNLNTVVNLIKSEGRELVFEMNAGMFDRSLMPIGLFKNPFQHEPINLQKEGYGNFYDLPPNGVFYVDNNGIPGLLASEDYYRYIRRPEEVAIATQSGPMLVTKGTINAAFNEGSKNRKIRNGIGVDRAGNVIMIVARKPVNFYDFTMLFMEKYGCDNALCLDGVVSQYYIPGYDHSEVVLRQRIPLGPIIAVVKE